MVRFQRQPPGTAVTRVALVAGAAAVTAAGWLIVARQTDAAAAAAAIAGALLLLGGHRANHGAGGPLDRMLSELLDRGWDGAVLGSIAWIAIEDAPHIAVGALVALGASFLSSYVRARGAALSYSVEESHVTRGIRYALVSLGLGFDRLAFTMWATATLSVLAATVRTAQVAREERA